MKYEEGDLIKEDGYWMWYHICLIENTDMFIGKWIVTGKHIIF